jgi:hypothetical protein
MKKRTISNFNDQQEYKSQINRTVRSTQINGDQANETNRSEAGINFKNENTKNSLNTSDGIQINEYYNNFLSKDFDSSKDSEHYFDGANKFIDLKLSFFSTSVTDISGTFIPFAMGSIAGASSVDAGILDIEMSSDGAVYYVHNTENSLGYLSKSDTGASGTFYGIDETGLYGYYYDVAVSPLDGAVYVVGATSSFGANSIAVVRKSLNGASGTFTLVDSFIGKARGVAVSPLDGAVYVVGSSGSTVGGVADGLKWIIKKSSTGASGTFVVVDHISGSNSLNASYDCTSAYKVAVSPLDGAVYVVGSSGSGDKNRWLVRKSLNGASGTFSTIDSIATSSMACNVYVSPLDGAVYVGGMSGSWEGDYLHGVLRRSDTGASGSFYEILFNSASSVVPKQFSDVTFSQVDGFLFAVCSINRSPGVNYSAIYKSRTGASGTFTNIQNDSSTCTLFACCAEQGTRLYVGGRLASFYVLSGSVNNINSGAFSTSFTITGAEGALLQRNLKDQNNVFIVDGVKPLSVQTYDMSSVHGFSKTTKHNLLFSELKMSLSGVNESFNKSSISIKFKDGVTSEYSQYRDIAVSGTYLSSSESGWVDFIYDFNIGGKYIYPSMSYASFGDYAIIVSASAGKTYAFKNINLNFKEKLTNNGVSYYKTIDNTNNDDIFSYIKFNGTRIE